MNSKLDKSNIATRWNNSQRRICITGGIASGKSSVSIFLKESRNLQIIDADLIAKEALSPGQDAAKEVIKHYGELICKKNRASTNLIDRDQLGKIIFTDPQEKLWLEKVIHPIVTEKIVQEIYKSRDESTLVLTIPLLFEANLTFLCNEVWVVSCKREQQISRLMKRDDINQDYAEAKIDSQWPLEKKKKLADYIINNDGEKGEWIPQINALLNQ